MKKTIWVTFQHEGIHKYPQALTDPALEDVSFLGYPHRHIFHFRVEIEVFHDDREIEFILFKRELQSLYTEATLQLDYKSCEMIGEDLLKYLVDRYPGRSINISVAEDNENGATIYYNSKEDKCNRSNNSVMTSWETMIHSTSLMTSI